MSDTRNALLVAARSCIRQEGLAGATSRAITAEAGVNLGAITYHFDSKDRLIADALLDGLRMWLTPTLEVLTGPGDPVARTLSAVQTLTATFEELRSDAPMYLEALVQSRRMPLVRAGLLDLWSELRRLLADQMIVMQRNGQLVAWVDPEAMAALLIAVANGLVLQVTIDPGGTRLEAMAAQFANLLLAANEPTPGGGTPAT